MRVYYFLLCVYSVASVSDKETELENKRKTALEQLQKNRTVLLDGYHMVTRQVAPDIQMYRSYRTVSVIFFPIGRDVSEARFTFQSEELHWNNIGSCEPQDVVINIKRASYPAVNPDSYDFPKDFISPSSRGQIHTVDILSNSQYRFYSINNPKPGYWYALVYIKWEDPRTQKVEQQGLVADCSTIFYTDLQVKQKEYIKIIDCYAGVTANYANLPAYYKCIVVDSTDPITFSINVTNTTNSEIVLLRIQAQSLPTDEEYLITCVFDPKPISEQTITFSPYPNAFHYIHLDHVANGSRYPDCDSYRSEYLEESDYNHTVLDLMRDDKGRFFTFEYGLPTTDINDASSLINITSDEVKTVKFPVNEHLDIGGNLAIDVSLLMSLKYYMGYKREMKKGALLGFTEDDQFYKVVICMNIGHASVPLENSRCEFNGKTTPALFVLNSTDSDSIYKRIIIPYPESGTWYLTFRLFCDKVVCPCPTSHNGTHYYVHCEGSNKDVGDDISGELSNYTREGGDYCNTSVLLLISSSSCLSGRCSNHGNCLLNTYGGMVMSFCQCSAGYGGWDCSDDSRMDSKLYMLMSVLFLTLSNLLFLITAYIAIIRLYYTEAVMYTFTMVFSTFYHACDAPAQVAYCIVRGNILQFGDFYCGIMCFWVTLLAMSIITDKFRSSLQLVGAIIIALLTTWNMHSIISFMVPVIVGVAILLMSWFWDYKVTRKLRYPKSYYIKHFPVGLVLVSVGLICYAFLQTEQNYRIVHSIWHGIIALSVAFLLPDVKREGDPNPFLPSPNIFKLSFCKIFRRSQAPVASGTDNTVRLD